MILPSHVLSVRLPPDVVADPASLHACKPNRAASMLHASPRCPPSPRRARPCRYATKDAALLTDHVSSPRLRYSACAAQSCWPHRSAALLASLPLLSAAATPPNRMVWLPSATSSSLLQNHSNDLACKFYLDEWNARVMGILVV